MFRRTDIGPTAEYRRTSDSEIVYRNYVGAISAADFNCSYVSTYYQASNISSIYVAHIL